MKGSVAKKVGCAEHGFVSWLCSLLLLVQSGEVFALPTGNQTVAGSATVTTSSQNALIINQDSQRAVINWQGFGIASGESVVFKQPNASAVALNRVLGNSPSAIYGRLSANGQVFLVNPNGILFGPTASVDVGGLVASTLGISNSDFMAGRSQFANGKTAGSIKNFGQLTANNVGNSGGYIALVAPDISNAGTITASGGSSGGSISLAAGDKVTLDFFGDNLLKVKVDAAALTAHIESSGAIMADGGSVVLTAHAAGDLMSSAINQTGVIRARSLVVKNGAIVLDGGSSTVLVSGLLDASGRNTGETGGLIEVLGGNVGILGGAMLDVSGDSGGGTIRVGGDFHGQGSTPTAQRTLMQPGATLDASALASGNGGRVTLWADDWTKFAGNILARGGAKAGDGGLVETSGRQSLAASGRVDASAPAGKGGTWLLDPNNITINAAGPDTNVSASPNFTSTNDSAIVTTGSIQGALNGGTSVNVTTASAGANTQAGDITVSSTITKSAGGDAILSLVAANNIAVNAAISATTGKLGVVLNADSDASGSGQISVAAAITSHGGDISLGGGADPGTTAAIGNASVRYGVYITNAIDAGGGNISIRGTGYDTTTNTNHGVRITGAAAVVSTTGSGSISITGHGAGNTGSLSDYGIEVDTGALVSAANGALTLTGTGGATGTGSDIVGVYVSSATINTTGSGSLTVSGDGGSGSGGTNHGVIAGGTAGVISTVNGTLSVTGNGGGAGAGASNYGVLVTGAGSAIKSSGTGNVGVTGTGGNGAGSGANNWGVDVAAANGIQATGSGSITVNGTGSTSSGGGNDGVYVTTGSITAAGGAINITGNGGSGSGASNIGVRVNAATGAVINIGAGSLTITGTAAGITNSATDYGVEVDGGAIVSTVDGAITINGTGGGAGTGATNYGVYVTGLNTTIKTSGSGTLGVTGTGGNTAGSGSSNYGVFVNALSGLQNTSSLGSITVNGTGSTSSGGGNYGVAVTSGSITGAGGAISVTGTGGNNSGNGNYGVRVTTATGAISNTGAGTIDIIATGSGNTNSTLEYGLEVDTGGVVSTANGGLTIHGTGGGAGSGSGNVGVYVTGANSTIKSTGSGALDISGTGGNAAGSGGTNYGVLVSTANGIQTTGTGSITMHGTGSASSGGTNDGVLLSSGSITGGGGAINITGTGGNGSGNSNLGVRVTAAGSAISNTGTGTITIAGTGAGKTNSGSDYGVEVDAGGVVSTANGALSITGTGGGAGSGSSNLGVYVTSANSTIKTTGSGALSVTGIGGNGGGGTNYGVDMAVANGLNTTGTGALTVRANTFLLNTADNINSVDDLTIKPYTTGTTVGVGSGVGTLSLTDTYLGYLSWGAGKLLTIGDANTGNMDIHTGVTFSKPANFVTGATGDISLNGTLTSSLGSGTSLILASGKNFINNVGAAGLNPGSGRWLVYSSNPAADTRNSLAYGFKQYAATYGVTAVADATQNGFLYTLAPSITASLFAGGAAPSKTYDGSTSATLVGANYSVSGAVDGDSVTTSQPAAGNYVDKNVAGSPTKTVTANGVAIASATNGAATVYGYQMASTDAVGNIGSISAKPLTMSGLSVPAAKVYDGTLTAVVTDAKTLAAAEASGAGTTADGKPYTGDTVSLNGTAAGTYNSKDVGAATVTYSGLSLAGGQAGNYSLTVQSPEAATITAKPLTLAATAANKTYDGNSSATVTGYGLAGFVGTETVTGASTAATFADANAANGKTVTITGISLANGTNAGLAANYSVPASTTATANITPAAVEVSVSATLLGAGVTAANKVYDGTTAATITGRSLTGVIGNDDVSLVGGTANFDNKNVGVGKLVTATGLSLTGTAAGNYTANSTATTTADITPKSLTVGGLTAADKVYDATTAATLKGGTLVGIVGSDAVSLAVGTGAFADRNVGTGKSVIVNGTGLLGNDAANYSLAAPAGLIASITPRGISLAADDKAKLVGTIDPALTYQVTAGALLAGDGLSGSLVRAAGESLGPYAIAQGSLDNGNYAIAFRNGILSISSLAVTPIPLPVILPASLPVTLPVNPLLESKGKEDSFILSPYPSYRVDSRVEAISEQTLKKTFYEVRDITKLPVQDSLEVEY